MNRQQKRKQNRENQENTKNYGFSKNERNAIDNCVKKIQYGLACVSSIQPLTTPAPMEHDNFVVFRIGLANDIVYAIDCGTGYLLKKLKVAHSFQNLNGVLFANSLLMRNIFRRISDLALLWKNPQYTSEYRDHQINNEGGEWAWNRLKMKNEDKRKQGIIPVIEEIYQIKATDDYFKGRSDIFNDAFYGKHALERYSELTYEPDKNEESMRKTKGNIIQYVIDCYEFVDLILRGFQKYEQVTINNSPSLDTTKDTDVFKDTAILNQLREQYKA